jgi:hypothetical protein
MRSMLKLSFVIVLILAGAVSACRHVDIGPPPVEPEHGNGSGGSGAM